MANKHLFPLGHNLVAEIELVKLRASVVLSCSEMESLRQQPQGVAKCNGQVAWMKIAAIPGHHQWACIGKENGAVRNQQASCCSRVDLHRTHVEMNCKPSNCIQDWLQEWCRVGRAWVLNCFQSGQLRQQLPTSKRSIASLPVGRQASIESRDWFCQPPNMLTSFLNIVQWLWLLEAKRQSPCFSIDNHLFGKCTKHLEPIRCFGDPDGAGMDALGVLGPNAWTEADFPKQFFLLAPFPNHSKGNVASTMEPNSCSSWCISETIFGSLDELSSS